MTSFVKRCADDLRVFSEDHGSRIKASHAHEIVAAIFGYKSKAAMDADDLCSMENLQQANIYILTPSAFIDARRECLEGLPHDLPNTYALAEALIPTIEESFKGKSSASFSHFVETISGEYLQTNGSFLIPEHFGHYKNARHIFSKPIFEFKPRIQNTKDGLIITATNRYYGSVDQHFPSVDIMVTINLKRIAGHVGYTLLNITGETISVDRQYA